MEIAMSHKDPAFNATFITHQRQRLLQLKQALIGADDAEGEEQLLSQGALAGESREPEDDGQHMTELELNGQRSLSLERRLAGIDRALKKIEEGTYGHSDLSGEAIPVARLKAVPEATLTVKEQRLEDGRRGS
jgi:DnaK suppressor protein